jgi:pimeloyl-ACP methyl ester carboxylesterase
MMKRKIGILAILIITGSIQAKENKMESSQTKSQNGYAPVNGISMYYEMHGSGKIPLVLIHGGGSTIETTFGTIMPMLSKNRLVIAMDLQAHGRTTDRDSAESFEQDADDVAALLSYLQINKADFFGFSNGGNTAMQISMRHPTIVNKLIIASSFYQRDAFMPGFFEGMEHASLENMPSPLQKAFLKLTPDSSKLQNMHDKDKNRMLQFKDWTDESMHSIKAPTLLICGDHDVVTCEHQVKMSHIIPNAQLMILPGNHGSYIGEICSIKEGSKMPQITVDVIEEFLNE